MGAIDDLLVPALSGSLPGDSVGSADFVPRQVDGAGCGHGLIELGLDLLELFAQGADGVQVLVWSDVEMPLLDE